MDKDSIFSILAVLVALFASIISARKKAEAAKRARQIATERLNRTETTVEQREERRPTKLTDFKQEAPSAFKYADVEDEQDLTHPNAGKGPVKHHRPEGFDAKKAVLFSEILKPKFDQ